MNMKKIIIITLITIFALGILCGAAEASHTFKKGGYKMKVTDKQYNKLKKSSPYSGYYIQKKVGKKTRKTYKYKTVKTETYREYFDKNGNYKGCRVFTHHQVTGRTLMQDGLEAHSNIEHITTVMEVFSKMK